jgi:hypothetical protein
LSWAFLLVRRDAVRFSLENGHRRSRRHVSDGKGDARCGSHGKIIGRRLSNGPANEKYNASIGPLLGMGMPAEVIAAVEVHVTP